MEREIEKWVSLEEIADHMGISKDTIRNYIKKEQIPYYRIGKQYKFNHSLQEMGWTVVRLWESDIRADIDNCVQRIKTALIEAGMETYE